MTGSRGLEESLDWIADRMADDGLKVLRESVSCRSGLLCYVPFSERVCNFF